MGAVIEFPSKRTHESPAAPAATLQEAIDRWEFELDLLGPSPQRDELEALLARAPSYDCSIVQFVREHLYRATRDTWTMNRGGGDSSA